MTQLQVKALGWQPQPNGTGNPASAQEGVVRRFRLRARLHSAWLRKLWAEEGTPGGEQLVTHHEVDALLADRDNMADERRWLESEPGLATLLGDLHMLEQELTADTSSRFAMLCVTLEIGARERDLLEACFVLHTNPALGRVAAYLHDHASMAYMTAGLAARMYHHERPITLDTTSLSRWQVLRQEPTEPGHEPAIVMDPWIVDWLANGDALDPSLGDAAFFAAPGQMPESWPVEQTADTIRRSLDSRPTLPLRISIAGQRNGGRSTFAATVAAAVGMKSLVIDTDHVPDTDWHSLTARAVRFAMLNNTALIWKGERFFARPWTSGPPPLQFVVSETGQFVPATRGVADLNVELSSPPVQERQVLWQSLLPSSRAWPGVDQRRLAERHRVWPGEVAAAALHAPRDAEAASAIVRQKGRERLGSLAHRIATPFHLPDLIVHPQLRNGIEDVIFEARERTAFWERPEAQRLFSQGRGLLVLMSGPPGTGKTMAAQVIAAELGLDLFRIDLSSVVSKWVGETSKNLERLLTTAAEMDVVLLFDEADALFGKRTDVNDAQDRFANTDTGHLLQSIESYQGIAVLASNRKAEIDPAFIRRLRYVFEFREPDTGQRLEIWQRVLGELIGPDCPEALAGDLDVIARELEVTGAQIKYAILSSIFLARRAGRAVSAVDLVAGLDRELMKSGRGLSERDKKRLAS
ncbi:MAG: ATP-binding protein [Dehalococcoidia bacterium]